MGGTTSSRPRFAIITALPKELAAVLAILDDPQRHFVKGDDNDYYFCTCPSANGGRHLIVVTLLSKMGNNTAAAAASHLLRSFPSVEEVLMVGIAGGVPHPANVDKHVRLGDVVVTDEYGIVQYDNIKKSAEGTEVRDTSAPPSAVLIKKVKLLEAEMLLGKYPWEEHIARASGLENAARPDASTDNLYSSDDPSVLVPHPEDPYRERRLNQPKIHRGRIGSANTLQKDPKYRDSLRDEFNIRAIEMEGSGIADGTWEAKQGYILIRGICDYCDSHKNDAWQGYAAVAAAAYARSLLESIPSEVVPKRKRNKQSASSDAQTPSVARSKEFEELSRRLERLEADYQEKQEKVEQHESLTSVPDVLIPNAELIKGEKGAAQDAAAGDHSVPAAAEDSLEPAKKGDTADAKEKDETALPTPLSLFNAEVARLLNENLIDDALTYLHNPPEEVAPDLETSRLHALALIASKNLTDAENEISNIMSVRPEWRSARFVKAVFNYFSALSPAALPGRVVPYPSPVAPSLVKTDDASQQRLNLAANEFKALLAESVADDGLQDILEVWLLACLANDPKRQDEAEQYCRELLSKDPTRLIVIAWGMARNYKIDLSASERALEQRLGVSRDHE